MLRISSMMIYFKWFKWFLLFLATFLLAGYSKTKAVAPMMLQVAKTEEKASPNAVQLNLDNILKKTKARRERQLYFEPAFPQSHRPVRQEKSYLKYIKPAAILSSPINRKKFFN